MSTALSDPLPIELWLEILSYLPRSFRRRMIGVNRALFELALDDIYEEVRLCSDDEKSLFIVTQLQYLNIARRVRRIVVLLHPDLPLKRDLPCRPRNGITKFHLSPISTAKQPNFANQDPPVKRQDPFAQTLSIAQHTLRSCFNIRELKLVVNDSALPPAFKSFLKSLWHSESIGPRIQRLAIEVTAANLSALLELMSVHRLSCPTLNIEDLDLTFCHFHPDVDYKPIKYTTITSFFAALEPSLLSLCVSGYLHPHLVGLLSVSDKFTRLRKLELHSIFNIQDLQQVEPLNDFIARHSETLEHIVIHPQSRESASELSSRLFVHWLCRDDAFSRQQLPKLRILELAYQYLWAYPSIIFPNLNHIVPNLTTLSITKTELTFHSVVDLLYRVPRQNEICSIRSLKLHIDIVTPKLMDLFTRNLPLLDSLEMYVSCASENLENSAPEQYIFCERIRERKYPSWTLQYLRITSASLCKTPHPNLCIMEAVTATLSTSVILGLGYDCPCRPNHTPVGERWKVS